MKVSLSIVAVVLVIGFFSLGSMALEDQVVADSQTINVDEDLSIEITLTATGGDSDLLTFSVVTAPAHGTLSGTPPVLTYTPEPDFSGADSFGFVAGDGTGDSEPATISITVNDVNDAPVLGLIRMSDPEEPVIPAIDDSADSLDSAGAVPGDETNAPPVIAPIGDQVVEEGSWLDIAVWADDPDLDAVTYSAGLLPEGAKFYPDVGGFSWGPTYSQAGVYTVTFTASDGSLTDEETITITVTDVNPPPAIAPIGDLVVMEGSWLDIAVWADDPDGSIITYSAAPLPEGARFYPDVGGFSWGPTYSQAGVYTVTFTASDGSLIDEETVTITVKDVNPAPVLDPIGNQVVEVGSWLALSIYAYDPNGDQVTISADPLPKGATFDPATGLFSWGPVIGQAGLYKVSFTASDGTSSSKETITILVTPGLLIGKLAAGGGYLLMSQSAGKFAADPGTRNYIGLYVKVGPKGTILADRALFTFRNGGHLYLFRARAIDSVSVDSTSKTAILGGRGILVDISKPRAPVPVAKNAAVQVTLKDNGKPGSGDTIGITLRSRQGELLFSSNWDGQNTVEQPLIVGNLVVR